MSQNLEIGWLGVAAQIVAWLIIVAGLLKSSTTSRTK